MHYATLKAVGMKNVKLLCKYIVYIETNIHLK